MPKQRCILIFLLLFSSFAFAQISANLQGEGLLDNEDGYTFRSRMQLSYTLSDLIQVDIDNDNLWRDHLDFSLTQKGYNSLSGGVSANFDDGWYNASYRHSYYKDHQISGMYPVWNPLSSYQKNHQQQVWLAFDQDLSQLNISGNVGYKNLLLSPWTLNDIWELEQGNDINMQDYYGQMALGYAVSDDIQISAGSTYTQNDNSTMFNHNATWLNLEYGTKLMGGLNLQTQGQIQYRDGDWVDSYAKYQYVMNVRAQQYLPLGLSGYIQFTSRTCSDEDFGQWYLISNYLRTQMKYSLGYDPNSYVAIGGKYAPENEANAFFAETDVNIYHGIYLGASTTLNPDNVTDYSTRLSYQFHEGSQIYLTARNLEFQNTNWKRQYLGLGFAYYR